METKSLALYEIDYEIYRLIENEVDPETGELKPEVEKKLDELQIARKNKIVNIGHFIKNLNAYAAACKEEERKLAAKRRQAEKKVEWLKTYLSNHLEPGEKIDVPTVKISWRKSEAVETTPELDVDKLSANFPDLVRVKVIKEIDKTKAKSYLKEGIGITGLKLVQKQNIQIK